MTLKQKIRKYITEIGGKLEKEPINPRWEFTFRFKFLPNISITVGKQKGKSAIEIYNPINLSEKHQNDFRRLEKEKQSTFIRELRKIIIDSNFESSANLNPRDGKRGSFLILEKVFIENDSIPINEFYRSVKSVSFCSMKCISFIQNQLDKGNDPSKDGYDVKDFKPYFDE